MKEIKNDLEAKGWLADPRKFDGNTVLFINFSAAEVAKEAIKKIKRIVKDRAKVGYDSVGNFHTIIISR